MILCTQIVSAKGRDRQTNVEGQKAFFTKHNGISCCIKTWKMSVDFIHSEAKTNGYYCEISLKGSLRDIRHISDNDFILQHDGAPGHH